MVTFSVSFLFDNWTLSPKFSLTKSRTFLTFHTDIYLGLSGFELNTPDTNHWKNLRVFSDRRTINIFMEDKNCWPMQIYNSIFVTKLEKESQVFYNTLYRCLKRINFSFKTPASPFSPGWLVIKECVFSSGICDNVRSTFWNSFTQKGFPETKQAASVNKFSSIIRCTIFLVK